MKAFLVLCALAGLTSTTEREKRFLHGLLGADLSGGYTGYGSGAGSEYRKDCASRSCYAATTGSSFGAAPSNSYGVAPSNSYSVAASSGYGVARRSNYGGGAASNNGYGAAPSSGYAVGHGYYSNTAPVAVPYSYGTPSAVSYSPATYATAVPASSYAVASGYSSPPVTRVLSLSKVVNVQREVTVPQVINVRKVITEPKVITVQQVVPSTGFTGYGAGVISGYSGVRVASGYSDLASRYSGGAAPSGNSGGYSGAYSDSYSSEDTEEYRDGDNTASTRRDSTRW